MRYESSPVRIAVDIETMPLPQAEDFLEPVSAPGNYKDEEKIAAYIREATAQQLSKCSLDLDLCEIAAIGWQREDEAAPTVLTRARHDESAMLWAFWTIFPQDTPQATILIGHNLLAFDLPILQRRSLYLNVPAPTLNVDKYRTPHIDLQERLSYNGKLKWRSLDFYCNRFALDVPEDEYRGQDIGRLVAEGNWAAVEAHCASDVRKVLALARRIGVLSQQPVPTHTRTSSTNTSIEYRDGTSKSGWPQSAR